MPPVYSANSVSALRVKMRIFKGAVLALLLVWSFASQPAYPYSLLTHEQLIDLTWKDSIAPLLRSRYPGSTPVELEDASSDAYDGSVLQDIG